MISSFYFLPNKSNLSFLQFDINNYYESKLLIIFNKVIILAKTLTNITPLEIDILLPAIKTLIKFNDNLWHCSNNKLSI